MGIKPQEVGSLDLWTAAMGDGANETTEQTCGSYRRKINGDRSVKTTDFKLPGSAHTGAVCLSETAAVTGLKPFSFLLDPISLDNFSPVSVAVHEE